LKNATEFDFICYLVIQGIESAAEYYDPNRVLKIRDRLNNIEEVGPLLEQVLKRLRKVSRENVP
jgi:hypothetical protein